MALTTSSTARDIIAAIVAASTVVPACTVYPNAPASGSLFRFPPVPANALGYLLVDLTPLRTDPNGVSFVPVVETLAFSLVNQKFSASTTAACVTLAVTAIEADIAAILVSEVAGPRIRVLLGASAVITKPNVNFQLSLDRKVLRASDAGPLGRFV